LLFQSDGHPGQAYGCRCTAEPVWPEALSKSRLPTPSEQAINNATFSTFFAFYGVLGLIRSLVLAGSAGLTALRSGYQALVRSFMRSVAQKDIRHRGEAPNPNKSLKCWETHTSPFPARGGGNYGLKKTVPFRT
jgi:hypothetical protein